MPKVELSKVDVRTGSSYPAPFDEPCLSRRSERLSDAGGLTQSVFTDKSGTLRSK